MNRLKRGTCYHGNAGVASAFAALADKKLKDGGVLALVLPLSVANGSAWSGFREMLVKGYEDITVLSIAANGKDMAFSSDTGMADCLVLARKGTMSASTRRSDFVSLRHRPKRFIEAAEVAKNIGGTVNPRAIDDGPYGGTSIMVGDELSGEVVSALLPKDDNDNFGAVRISDYSLAQTAYALSDSALWLPGSSVGEQRLCMALLGEVGEIGLYHLDIIGPPPRGPFTKMPGSPTATYPALWNHDATKETRMVCAPDSQLQVRQGFEAKAADAWATASHAHLNLDFTFGSQALAVAFTDMESIGGRVWPNVIFSDKRFCHIFSVWGNSTLGFLSYWWHSNRQQSSKAGMTTRSAGYLPVIDLRALSEEQLRIGETIFDEFRDKELMPAYLADADPNRALLDRRVVCDLLGFDEDTYRGVRRLAAKWCAEPSVHGGKARPRSVRYVE